MGVRAALSRLDFLTKAIGTLSHAASCDTGFKGFWESAPSLIHSFISYPLPKPPSTHTHQGKAHEGYLIQISPTLLTHHSCGCKSLCQTSTIWWHITEREPRTAQRSWQGQRKNEGITERIRSRRHGLELEQTEKKQTKKTRWVNYVKVQGLIHPIMKNLSSFTSMSFQTCMLFFLLRNTKYILKNVSVHTTYRQCGSKQNGTSFKFFPQTKENNKKP